MHMDYVDPVEEQTKYEIKAMFFMLRHKQLKKYVPKMIQQGFINYEGEKCRYIVMERIYGTEPSIPEQKQLEKLIDSYEGIESADMRDDNIIKKANGKLVVVDLGCFTIEPS